MSPNPPHALAEQALAIHSRLCAAYGCPIPYFHAYDPLSELVSSLLSHRTRNPASGRAIPATHHQNDRHNLAHTTTPTNPSRLMKDGG